MKYPIKKFAMLAVLLLGVLASCNMPEEYAPNIRPTLRRLILAAKWSFH